MEYKIVDTASAKKMEEELRRLNLEGWELVEFQTAYNPVAWWTRSHYVALLRRSG